MKTFCKWCNSEAEETCDLCKSPYCRVHRSSVTNVYSNLRLSSNFSHDNLLNFTGYLFRIFPDPEIPPGYSRVAGNYSLTYKNFYEKVYSKIDFKKFPKYLCKYCNDKVPQMVKETLFPFFQIAKDSGLICTYYMCPFDAEWKCAGCTKYFCSAHATRCSRCSKVFCYSARKKGTVLFLPNK